MASGAVPAVVVTIDALMTRTLPPQRLAALSVTLRPGDRVELGALTERLVQAGYSRCEQVEGVGQFAIRGGILDVFSPLMEQPVRCEFFDDEVDSLGAFDPGTQRRTENVSVALLLPAAEVLPGLAPGGPARLAEELERLAVKYAKKAETAAVAQTLRGDAERFRTGAAVEGLEPLSEPYLPGTPFAARTICRRTPLCSSARAGGWTSGRKMCCCSSIRTRKR